MERTLVKGLALIAAGGCAAKALMTIRKYKKQQDIHEEIKEDAKDEK